MPSTICDVHIVILSDVVAPDSSLISCTSEAKVAVGAAAEDAVENVTTVARVVGLEAAEVVAAATSVAEVVATATEEAATELERATDEVATGTGELVLAADDIAAEADNEDEDELEPGPGTESVTSPLSI